MWPVDAHYPPSAYALEPGRFGDSRCTGFISTEDPYDRALAQASRTQHQVALIVRQRLRETGTSQAELARQLGKGWRAPKVSRILSGMAFLSLADMHALLNFCGLDIAGFAVLAADDGVPKGMRDHVIADFLVEQLRTVQAGNAGTGSGRPSTATPLS